MFILIGAFALIALAIIAVKSTKLALACLFWVFNLRIIHGLALVAVYFAIQNQGAIDSWIKKTTALALDISKNEQVKESASQFVKDTELVSGTLNLAPPKFLDPIVPEAKALWAKAETTEPEKTVEQEVKDEPDTKDETQ